MPVSIGKNDRVLIVGAGPAGLHAAHLLKKKGVQDIQILERSERVGGKSWTVSHQGILYEMGTCFLHNRYVETRRLIKELGTTPSEPIKGGSVIVHNDFRRFARQQLLPTINKLWEYAKIRQKLLGPETLGIPKRPTQEALQALSIPALAFFQKYDLFPLLERNFRTAFSAQGYGYLEDTPALYALLWFEPKFLRAVVVSTATMFLRTVYEPLWRRFTLTHILPDGFGNLMQELANKLSLPIEYNAKIEHIERGEQVVVRWQDQEGQHRQSEADWLLWTPPLTKAQEVLTPAPHEEAWFTNQSSATITTTAYVDEKVPNYTQEGRECLYFQERTTPDASGRWFADRAEESMRSANPLQGKEHRLAFQYTSQPSDHPEASSEAILAQLNTDLREAGRTEASVLEHDGLPFQKCWSYFHRFQTDAVASGIHWDILQRQGQHRTFWLGSSVWFEAVEHVFRYNRAVLGG
ncbi:MAG: FAD-dependent oxidoreductase [Myxococcales bacterium]|nr:FAD-dependent oxidoreductase [Myxococcales bacterium]MCB9642531.1 FAD-dependent oxidoreductase [Myxococcales bacterium]